MSEMQHLPGRQTLDDESVAELVKRAASQTAELVRKEIQLGQVELKDKGRRAGKGIGLLGAAGLIAFYGGGALIAAAVLGLAAAVEPWLSALITWTPPGPVCPTFTSLRWPSTLSTTAPGKRPTTWTWVARAKAGQSAVSRTATFRSGRDMGLLPFFIEGFGLFPALETGPCSRPAPR